MAIYLEEIQNNRFVMLTEAANKTELAEMRKAKPQSEFVPIPAYRAHRYVKEGYIHATALWVDEGRIRRASE